MQYFFPIVLVALSSLCVNRTIAEDKVLFEDTFDSSLSAEWKAVGLAEDEFRIRDGALEMLVQPGHRTKETPMLLIELPFNTSQTVIASVDVTIINKFTEPTESAGLFLTDEHGREFAAEKRNLDGRMVFSPGNDEFVGEAGEEGDPQQYALKFWPANDEFGSVRIISDRGYAHFQVGPSQSGKYLNFFHSSVRKNAKKRGFALSASGGPKETKHWVRFDNFKVVRR